MTKHKRDKAKQRHKNLVKARNIERNTPTGTVRTSSTPIPIEATPEEIQAQKEELEKGGYNEGNKR